MATSSSCLVRISINLQLQYSISHNEPFRAVRANHFTPRHHHSRAATLTCSVRRRSNETSKISKRKKLARKNVEKSDVVEEDPFEALFRQLEEDLKNDELNGDEGEDDISEEEFAQLERELAALGDDDLLAALESIAGGEFDSESVEEDPDIDNGEDEVLNDDYEDGEVSLDLEDWQIRRLAQVLKYGRRKTRIKDLAAELGLDRDEVIKLLHDPPPSLVRMSAALPDNPVSVISNTVEEETIQSVETLQHVENAESEKKEQRHIMHRNWSAKKRLTEAQVETLEQVYTQTKHPTKATISNVVHLTNLPRKRVVKWFEDKRAEEGAPENHVPYRKAASTDTVSTS